MALIGDAEILYVASSGIAFIYRLVYILHLFHVLGLSTRA